MATTILLLILLSICWHHISAESHSVGRDDVNFDDVPGLGYELRVPVVAGKEQCFFQFIKTGSNLYISFQVLKGGDGKAGFAVKNPEGKHVLPYTWETEKHYEEVVQRAGIYEICADNSLSRFADKLINIYIISFKHHEWEQYTQELSELEGIFDNFTTTIDHVEERLSSMRKNQEYSKSHMARDAYLITSNNKYVQYWSLAQCAIIMTTFTIQVYFVKKLFDTKSVTPTAKPRA